MKANVYVDGFNLYYGAVKGTPYRWLDIAAMCRLLLPHDQINQIKYFTALINPRPQTRINPPVSRPTCVPCARFPISPSSWATF